MAFELERLSTSMASPRSDRPERALLFGLSIDSIRMQQAVERCLEAIKTRRPVLVGVLNAAKIVNMRHDPGLREALLDCDMLLADGQSVVWASWLLGHPLPERIAGIDLFEKLLELAQSPRCLRRWNAQFPCAGQI